MIINRFYCCMLGISTFAGLAAAQGAMNVTASQFVPRSGRFNGWSQKRQSHPHITGP